MFYLKGRLSVRTQRTCSLNLSPTIILIIPFTYSILFHCISMWRTWAQRVLLGGNLLLFPSSNVLPCGTVVATPRFSAYFQTETCLIALVRNTWTFSLTFSLNSHRRCAHIVEKPFQFKDSLNSRSDCPELRHITNNGTLTARNDHHAGSVFHNKPGSLLFWHSTSGFSTHVRDRDPLPTSL